MWTCWRMGPNRSRWCRCTPRAARLAWAVLRCTTATDDCSPVVGCDMVSDLLLNGSYAAVSRGHRPALVKFSPRLAEVWTPISGESWVAKKLGGEWPSYLAFLTSFGTILIMWINHHAVVKLVRRADTLFVFANGFHLLHVTIVPFITALVARYLSTPAASTACAVYAGVFAAGHLVFHRLWRVGGVSRALPPAPPARAAPL